MSAAALILAGSVAGAVAGGGLKAADGHAVTGQVTYIRRVLLRFDVAVGGR